MNNHDFHEDGSLTAEQQKRIGLLSQGELLRIDAELLRCCSDRWQKVSRVIGSAMSQVEDLEGVPDLYFSFRIRKMVEEGRVVSRGDIEKMRYCEVRLA